MSAPIKYIEVSNGVSNWKIGLEYSYDFAEKRKNILLIATEGFFTVGENIASSYDRTYSDGSVLPPAPRFSGKDFTLDFIAFSGGKKDVVDVWEIYYGFENILKSPNLTISSSYTGTLQCQLQRIDWVDADFIGERIVFRVFLKSASA